MLPINLLFTFVNIVAWRCCSHGYPGCQPTVVYYTCLQSPMFGFSIADLSLPSYHYVLLFTVMKSLTAVYHIFPAINA